MALSADLEQKIVSGRSAVNEYRIAHQSIHEDDTLTEDEVREQHAEIYKTLEAAIVALGFADLSLFYEYDAALQFYEDGDMGEFDLAMQSINLRTNG